MKSEIQTNSALDMAGFDLLEKSIQESNPLVDSSSNELKPTRTSPQLIYLKLGNNQDRNQKQRNILSNIIKLVAPDKQPNQVLDQKFQILISNQEQALPDFPGRLISKDQDFPQQPHINALKIKISEIKEHKSESKYSKIKRTNPHENLEVEHQNPEYAKEKLMEQIKKLQQKVVSLQNKLEEREASSRKNDQRIKEKELQIAKYLKTIKSLQEQNHRLKSQNESKLGNSKKQSFLSQLIQNSRIDIFEKSENNILINLQSQRPLKKQYFMRSESHKNRKQICGFQKSSLEALKLITKLKSQWSEDERIMFIRRIGAIF